MRFYFIFLLILFVSCQEEETITPSLPNAYGDGMYIVTDLGIHYLDYKDSAAVVQTQIFNVVNSSNLINPKNITKSMNIQAHTRNLHGFIRFDTI